MAGVLDSVNQRTQLVGQNRLELLMFRLNGPQLYGINVFKVKEVLPCPALSVLPHSSRVVRGVAYIRGRTISILDLSVATGSSPLRDEGKGFIIITEYNNSVQGFLVSGVERIVNLNWEDVHSPPKGSGRSHYLTAVTRVDQHLVEILDVERILAEVSPAKKGLSPELANAPRREAEINTVLIAAIAFGVVLSSSAYIFNILNSFRRNDLEKALFGEHGLAGLLLLWSAILLALGIIADIKIIPQPILIILMILMIAALIAKQPLTRMIQGKKPLHTEPVSSYYIENSFGLIETLIAMLSGTISFVRVGAFAINHAGLFLAFETIGHMIGTSGGMISMTILGNIIIIGLEGLIVFIQGLRLEFYELFSKYYQGDGIPFEPISYKK